MRHFPQIAALDSRPCPGPSLAGPTRVLLLLQSLSGGGAERVAVNIANHCDPAAVDVRLGLMKRAGPYLAEIDPDRVLGGAAPWGIAAMIRASRAQVLMTFGMDTELLAWPALRTLGSARPSWICRGDSNPDAEIDKLPIGPVGRAAVTAAMRRIHRSADGVVAVAKDLADRIDDQSRARSRRARVIYNPVDIARVERFAVQRPWSDAARPFVVAAGRLVRQKGFDLLIRAFADSEAARGMDLVILGEGPLESELRAQAAGLGIAGRVRFVGFQSNPWAWFARARLFVLPSRWEGFGNVVAEALACGAPTLVTDCDFGPREQVVHGLSGWVARSEDAGALTAALDTLLGDPALAAALGAAGRMRARAFDVAAIAGAYTRLFREHAALREARHREFEMAANPPAGLSTLEFGPGANVELSGGSPSRHG